jgi:quercetin dioxygenase-like cupin family protein
MAEAQSPVATSFPLAQLDLLEEIRQLRASPMPHGHVSKTVVHYPDLRVVLMVLQRGAQIPRHHAKGSLAVQVLDGRVMVGLLDTSFDLGEGRLLAIQPAIEHSVMALEDSALMLTVAHASPARTRETTR